MHLGRHDIYTVGTYHPRRGGNNTLHDDFSRRILNLKDGPDFPEFDHAVRFFKDAIAKAFPTFESNVWSRCVLCVVPSHDPSRTLSGVHYLADKLVGDGRLDGIGSLLRFQKVSKQADGGGRGVLRHLESVEVNLNYLPDLGRYPILLLDDVTTTGSSLLACRKLLLRAGVRRVVPLALGETHKYGG